ncbi:MAG: hypothetical protein K2J70_06630, partial [Muribaculaceae bacterium]|nr:hypothetical protein [Muribaculaceae bacterium]
MKKILFFVVIALCGLKMKAAEQFDELNLRGGWELVSYTGSYDVFTTPDAFGDAIPAISDCKYLYVGDMTSGSEEYLNVNLPGLSKPVVFLDYV